MFKPMQAGRNIKAETVQPLLPSGVQEEVPLHLLALGDEMTIDEDFMGETQTRSDFTPGLIERRRSAPGDLYFG